MMFERLDMAPADAILGLTADFDKDTNREKINLGVGVYRDADGRTPIFQAVKDAERRLLAGETTKSYKPIDGDPAFIIAVQRMMLNVTTPAQDQGQAPTIDHDAIASKRIVTAHTPGGTGALRVAADYLHAKHPDAAVWLSDPTWANHASIFASAGVKTKTYPYFEKSTNGLDADGFMSALEKIPAGDVVLLHGCCHNPTGVDPTPEQWRDIAYVLSKTGALPLLDFAYQGFGEGLDEDAVALRELVAAGRELVVCSSMSKNFGLYNERVGALSMIAGNAETAERVMSHVKRVIRTNYSNPPAHGAAVVSAVLNDRGLRMQWDAELAVMRNRIHAMRSLLVELLDARNVELSPDGNGFINRQRGMFSFSGLSPDQVKRLREESSIYIVGSGRINVAGITPDNAERLADAIATVV